MTAPTSSPPRRSDDPAVPSFLRLVSSRSVTAAPGEGGPAPLLVAAVDDLPELPGEAFVATMHDLFCR